MAANKKTPKMGTFPTVSAADEKRLLDAGFAPVVRWVEVRGRSDVALKTIEALTRLDRREAQEAKARG
jgi:hypothetical protein